MENIYTNGRYLEHHPTWHSIDSAWKAEQISKIILANRLQPESIGEIGCGAGVILDELSKKPHFEKVWFRGYDVSPQAIEFTRRIRNKRIEFVCGGLSALHQCFDILLVIDVFEHIPDYMGFLHSCRRKGKYKIYHIPLDIHVSSLLRNACMASRYTLGHLHYFTADSAIATLKDTGHKILDSAYTNSAIDLFSHHPSLRRALANIPRWLLSKFSSSVAAKVLGGYSLLVLTK